MRPAFGVFLLGVCLLISSVSLAAVPAFRGIAQHPTERGAQSICVADFNSDGFSDFAFASAWGGAQVVLSDGAGGFGPEVGIGPYGEARSAFCGDVDDDGDMDLIVTYLGLHEPPFEIPDFVGVLLNDGNGTFAEAPLLLFGSNDSPAGGCAADLNDDGNADLVVALAGINQVRVYVSAGDGTFDGGTNYPAGSGPNAAAMADFNDDGDIDIVVTNFTSGTVSVLLGAGDGTLGTAMNSAVGSGPVAVCTGDFNEDDSPDVAVARTTAGIVAVAIGNGDGTFGVATNYTVPSARGVCAADLDGNGHLDLATAGTTVCTLAGDGSGSFSAADCGGGGATAYAIATGNANQDAHADLFAGHGLSMKWISVFVNVGDGSFEAPSMQTAGDGPWAIVSEDVNGDGDIDVVITNRYDNDVSVYINSGGGTYAPPMDYPCGIDPLGMCTGDFDGDGDRDLAVSNYTTTTLGSVSVLLNNGNGVFDSPINYAVLVSPLSICAADLNGDDADEIMVVNQRSDQLSVLINQGNGLFDPAVHYPAGSSPRGVLAADFNDDDDVDMAVGNEDGLMVFENDGAGVFSSGVPYPTVGELRDLCGADFTGDGILDIAAGGGAVYTFAGNGTGGFSAAVQHETGYSAFSICAADLDGDNDNDVVMSSLTAGAVLILTNDGAGAFPGKVMYVVPTPNDVAAGDIDGDGDTDLVMPSFLVDALSTLWNEQIVAPTTTDRPNVRLTGFLDQNAPNPFNPTTTIRYRIPEHGLVTLAIYNVRGQLVRTLVRQVQSPIASGNTVTWDGRNEAGQSVASGVYFYRLTAGSYSQVRKMMLLK